jgi:hypothetical protein
MKFKPHHSIALLVAAMPLVATLGASAQEAKINFVCGTGTGLYQSSGGVNKCPATASVSPFYSWTQQGFTVLNNSPTGTEYNINQGDAQPGGAPQSPVNPPALPATTALMSGASISLTVTDGTSYFEFNEVDVRNAIGSSGTAGAVSYTITGTNSGNSADDFTLTCGSSPLPACPAAGLADYTTILGGADSSKPINSLTITEAPLSGNYAYLDQLYVTNVPEGGAELMYLLLAGGACFGAMFLVPRNRYAKLATA